MPRIGSKVLHHPGMQFKTETKPGVAAGEIIQTLPEELPELAISLIEDRPENANFRRNPDDPQEHQPGWHQWGIITHSQKCVAAYHAVMHHLEIWEIARDTERYLLQRIGDKGKGELLPISIALHDLGKFAREFRSTGGALKPDHGNHARKSEQIILGKAGIKDLLRKHGLSGQQIRYIAHCAGVHYELGLLRHEAMQDDLGYTLAFLKSERCRQACLTIARSFPEMVVEIGLLFLCDSLAKIDILDT